MGSEAWIAGCCLPRVHSDPGSIWGWGSEQAGLLGTWPLCRAKCLLWGRKRALMAGADAARRRGNVGLQVCPLPLPQGGITGRSGGSGTFRFLCSHPKIVHSPSNTNFHLSSVCPTSETSLHSFTHSFYPPSTGFRVQHCEVQIHGLCLVALAVLCLEVRHRP